MTQHGANGAAEPAIPVVAINQGNPARGIEAGDARRRPAFEWAVDRKVLSNHALVRCDACRGHSFEPIIGVEYTKLGWGDLQAVCRLAAASIQKLGLWQAKAELGLQGTLA